MDWTQTVTLGTYLTAICAFFYYLNEKTIKEWREEHARQIAESNDRSDKRMDKSDQHWREMFTYMNNKIDEVKKPS
jgi:hypothetical protein